MANIIVISWDPEAVLAAGAPSGRYGRSTSLKWPALYDRLRAKGYDKSKAAAISNSRLRFRKKGRLNILKASDAHNPAVLKRFASADKAGKHVTGKQLTKGLVAACYDAACRPPTSGGTGGSKKGGAGTGGSLTYLLTGKKGGSRVTAPKKFKTIKPSEARGDSRPVSEAEFQSLATKGRQQLDKMALLSTPTHGLNARWETIKAESYAEATKSWGGATINAHTGLPVPQGANRYALTVKDPGIETVSVKEGASRAEFDVAMETAKVRFGKILERQGHHLGVFHDDDTGRIDIDPVLVVDKSSLVETIGAATRAVGGAYNFRDGLGYWPPHVDTSPTATRKRDDYERTYES